MKTTFTVKEQMDKMAGGKAFDIIPENFKSLLSIDFYGPTPFKKIVEEILYLIKDKKEPPLRFSAVFWAVMDFNSDLFFKEIRKVKSEDLKYFNDILDSILKVKK